MNSAALVTAVADPGTMPTGTGGTVADGLYHLTELKTYPGSPLAGFKIKLTVLIKDGVSYQVTDVDGNPKSLRKTEQDNPDGGHGILACSNHGPGSLTVSSYTATCNEIMTYDATEKFSTKLVRQ
ncbi:MAG TPA: hypothetical protein VM925_13550 [Labilithrix sp.]|nr:hypothetical protein [Labilithrix sp.]